MKLIDIIPAADVLCALEPDELGLRMLRVIGNWRGSPTGVISLPVVLQTWLGDDRVPRGEYPLADKARVGEAVREAWAWLEGMALLVEAPSPPAQTRDDRLLSRRARQLAAEPDARRILAARHVSKEVLHLAIREDVWSLYHRGKYDTAVFEAMKAVEVAVRDAAHMPNSLVGTRLMRAAFAPVPNAGPLADTAVDGGEQVARMELFAGAIGSYKNSQSHRSVALNDPDEAAEIIMLANHLLRIVDSRKTTAP